MKKQTTEKQIIPLHDLILIKPDVKEEKRTKSGLILNEEVPTNELYSGTVLRTGPEIKIKVQGTVRVFWDFGGREVSYDGENYILIRESEVLAYEQAG